jgi:hypothetical protein
MSELKYLDYIGLLTYTDHVKDFVNSKIVYLEDESQIPDPPVEGTLYVIGSNVLLDEELLFATVSGNTLTANSIDTQVHNGKRVAVWVDNNINSTSGKTLTLNFSEGDPYTARIYFRPGTQLTNEYSSGPIRLTYLENVSFRNTSYTGWFCDADTYSNKVTNNTTTSSKYYLTGSTSNANTTGELVKRSTIYVDTDGHLYDYGYQIPSVPIDPIFILANLEW